MLKWQKLKRVLSILVSSALVISTMSVAGYSALAEDTVSDNNDFAPYFTPGTFVLFGQAAGKADKWGQFIDKNIWWSWSIDCTGSWANNVALNTDVLCNGKNSVKLTNSGTTRNTHMDAYFKLKPNHTYTLSVYVKTEGPIGGQDMSSGIYVNYSLFKDSIKDAGIYDTSAVTAATLVKDVSLTNQKGKTVFQDFEEWEQLKATFTTTADTSVGMVGLYLWNNSGRTYFSNLQLKDGDVAWDNATTTTSESTAATDAGKTDAGTPETISTVPETSASDENGNPNTSDSVPYPALAVGLLSVTAVAGAFVLRKKQRAL